ncbi:PEP-CTERM/exosortase system-associated acyltransferase [Psychrosphaera haliotis]|uniref:PEP-CTERM/exosortase system-associated acyltransferase n=1 Tax=Psychrosphaera haliotis TaxID=555083 RepID=A0A6N8FAM4_9GAMM|nr:PEP-CTERM/exosortase system-associated acyltransferase [Psychrosphaera haliotis]
MNTLKKLSKQPIIGVFVKVIIKLVANFQAKKIASHFSAYLQPVIAHNEYLKEKSFGIRHNVYCEELGFEECNEDKQEKDEFDIHSIHCVMQHRSTKRFAGTVRIVYSLGDKQQLPLEKYCLDSIDHPTLNPVNFPRHKICEISRLAVPNEFRRRQSDKFKGAATGAINENEYSEKELRCFPFIAIGLYMSAASIAMNKEIEHAFVMMEPRLARSLRFVGIEFQQIGPVVDYHGKRAPFYISSQMLLDGLTPGFKKLFEKVREELDIQVCGDPEILDGIKIPNL